MSRVVTGLSSHSSSQHANSASRPLTLSERFAAITPNKAAPQSNNSSSSSSSYAQQRAHRTSASPPTGRDSLAPTSAADSSLSSRFASVASSNGHGNSRNRSAYPSSTSSSSPAPTSAAPTPSGGAAGPRARQIRLKGGRTVNVGAEPSSTAARASSQQQQQRKARLNVVQKRRLTVKPAQRPTPAGPAPQAVAAAMALEGDEPMGGDLGAMARMGMGSFNPFLGALAGPFSAVFNPGTVAPPLPMMGGRQGVKARGRGGKRPLPGQIALGGVGEAGKKKKRARARKGVQQGAKGAV